MQKIFKTSRGYKLSERFLVIRNRSLSCGCVNIKIRCDCICSRWL